MDEISTILTGVQTIVKEERMQKKTDEKKI
jgi:hypothetical protein